MVCGSGNRIIRFFLIAVLAMAANAGHLNAAEKIKVFGDYSNPPYIYLSSSGQTSGILVDVLKDREPQPFWRMHTARETEYDSRLPA